jgi:REP-associated tyrosine transposase
VWRFVHRAGFHVRRRYGRRVPRVPRSYLPDGFFHVTSRGVAKTEIYLDDDDRRFFLRLVHRVTRVFAWEFYALCLMNNHFHFVVEVPRAQLSLGMHRLNGTYALAFNRKYGRWGHLFGERFATRVVDTDEYLATVCAYVIENPVRAGLCKRAADWPWSRSRFGFDPDA